MSRDEPAGKIHTGSMYLEALFERFARKSPVTVMTRALMENGIPSANDVVEQA